MAGAIKNKTEYTKRYCDIDGIDLRGDGSGIDPRRLAFSENVYRDPSVGGVAVESIPGFRRLARLSGKINGIHRQNIGDGEEYLIIHAGNVLYRLKKSKPDSPEALVPLTEEMPDTKSHSYSKGGSLFIIDGTGITQIKSDGSVLRIGNGEGYVPTTFKNGIPHEQRNLASSRFREIYEFGNAERLYRRSDDLVFEADSDGKSCTLTATKSTVTGEIYVPAYAKIGEDTYRVRAIGDYAFAGRTSVTSVHIADGVTSIGRFAFKDCSSIVSIEFSASTESIGEGAFWACGKLSKLYLGRSLVRIGENAFVEVPLSGVTVSFGMDEATAKKIDGFDQLSSAKKVYLAENPKEYFAIPIMTPLERIESVLISGSTLESYSVSSKETGDIPRYLYFAGQRSSAEGAEVVINGVAASGEYSVYEERDDFISRSGKDTGVISGCTVSASFDGRIFLAGNPKYPNTVFYSCEAKYGEADEVYFGTLSYFDDGVATYSTVAMVPVKDTLAVFKSGDDGGGSIFCHEVKNDNPLLVSSYPVLNIHAGFGIGGAAISMLDEAVFLSGTGVYSLERGSLGSAKVTPRSRSVTPRIAALSDRRDAELLSWRGYIVLRIGSDVLLGDPSATRSSEPEYGWYLLTGIGSWDDDRAVFVYSAAAEGDYAIHPDTDTEVTDTVYSADSASGANVYFIIDEDGTKYAVCPTGERRGGKFYPPTAMLSDGELLFFGTENGDLMLFNNDKRGVPPEHIAARGDFNGEEYRESFGERIHPHFYSFASHAPRYALVTKSDDCDAPHLAKSTVTDSLAVKLGTGGSHIRLEVSTDGGKRSELCELSAKRMDFSDLDFSDLSFETGESFTVGVKDRSRGWCEKQISIYSDEYASPISVHSVSYRYKLSGKIKRH